MTLTSAQLTGLLFRPVADANGAAGRFSYTVNDGNGGSDSQTVTLDVTPVNDAPVADADKTVTVAEDSGQQRPRHRRPDRRRRRSPRHHRDRHPQRRHRHGLSVRRHHARHQRHDADLGRADRPAVPPGRRRQRRRRQLQLHRQRRQRRQRQPDRHAERDAGQRRPGQHGAGRADHERGRLADVLGRQRQSPSPSPTSTPAARASRSRSPSPTAC